MVDGGPGEPGGLVAGTGAQGGTKPRAWPVPIRPTSRWCSLQQAPPRLVDTVAPTVSGIAITSATGVQNNRLNAGDQVSVTVTMSEAVLVTGTPRLALLIGGNTVQASYVSGSGTSALVFRYTVLTGQTDSNGIAIAANALTLNGGSLRDAAGNAAVLTHTAVADNALFRVDTTSATIGSVAITSATGVPERPPECWRRGQRHGEPEPGGGRHRDPPAGACRRHQHRAGQLFLGQRHVDAGVPLHRGRRAVRQQRHRDPGQCADAQRRQHGRPGRQPDGADTRGSGRQPRLPWWTPPQRRSTASRSPRPPAC